MIAKTAGRKYRLWLEVVWWLITFVVTAGFLLPVISATEDYPFLFINAAYIIILITLSRYIFFLKYTFIRKKQYVKIALFFLCIPLVFKLTEFLNLFITFIDEHRLIDYLSPQNADEYMKIENYIRTETIFFGVGSIIATVGFALRLLVSVWRVHNRGTV